MEIRYATLNDLDTIMHLVNQAKSYFKSHDIDQWQDGYPNEESFKDDIKKNHSYVLVDQDHVIGTMYFALEQEPTYDVIKNGKWLTDTTYGVVHRVIVDESYKGHGLAKLLLEYAEDQAKAQQVKSIRMDTHQDNKSMQRFMKKNGFIYCGEISVSNAPRIAFEKIL
jgi:ribosomal protein S18 acetylase RimI-like enzyme